MPRQTQPIVLVALALGVCLAAACTDGSTTRDDDITVSADVTSAADTAPDASGPDIAETDASVPDGTTDLAPDADAATSPDLGDATDTTDAAVDVDVPVNPVDPTEGVLGGWSAEGDDDAYLLTAAAFADGGAFLAFHHQGTIEIPLAAGGFFVSASPVDGDDQVIGLWLDDEGGVRSAMRIGTGRNDLSLHPLGTDLILQVHVGRGGVLLPEADAIAPQGDDLQRWFARVRPDGAVALLGQVRNAEGWGPELGAFAEGPDGSLYLAGPRGVTIDLVGGASLEVPPLAGDDGEWTAPSFWARIAPDGTVAHTELLAGFGATHINALAVAPNGDVWACGDVGGFGDDMTVVLDPGEATETTFTALSPDDDPASDLFFARWDAAGTLQTSWLHYGYENGLARPCDLQVDPSGDLFVLTNSTPRYHEVEPGVWGSAWTWETADGDVVTVEADTETTWRSRTLARYTAGGELVWHTAHGVYDLSAARLWRSGETLRFFTDVYDGNVLFTASSGAVSVATVPAETYIGARVTLAIATGEPIEVVGGASDVVTMLANGHFLVARNDREEHTVGTATDAPFVCPAGEQAHLCVLVFGPLAAVDGAFWE